MKKIVFTFSIFTLIGLSILQAQEDLAKKGLDIATKAVEADKGFGSVGVSLKMVLK
ncbi:MAG: outer membrane lipoprotein-sorting protein, partial [Flammeovirgaceae bacterium]|nr:outer membrane lipoprotein-sorting protein [Flammeovirgaceae bacterium]